MRRKRKKQKKGVEVYFVIYLATIISFFALEGEVKHYKQRQNDIILEIAREKIQQLVNIDRVEPFNQPDSLTLNVKLSGYYERQTLDGFVQFEPVPDVVNEYTDLEEQDLVFPLKIHSGQETDGWYTANIPKIVFGENGILPYNVTAEISVSPEFNEAVRYKWLEAYKDEKIVNKLISVIDQVGKITFSKSLPNAIVPMGGGNLSPFTMQVPKKIYSCLEGLTWEVPIFVGGVKEKGDFQVEISQGASLVSEEKIGAPEMRIGGLAKEDGKVVILGNRLSDSEKDTVEFEIRVRPPIWVKTPTTKQVYLGETYTFDGSLLDIPPDNMQIKVSGKSLPMDIRLVPGARVPVGPFDDEGNVWFQVMVNGIEIEGMQHTVKIVKPPKPEIKLIDREPKLSNNLIFEIVTFGKINKVVSFQQRGGIVRNQQMGDPEVRGGKKYYRWLVEIEEPFDEDAFQEISFKVWDNYNQFTEHRKQYQYNY